MISNWYHNVGEREKEKEKKKKKKRRRRRRRRRRRKKRKCRKGPLPWRKSYQVDSVQNRKE